jgi:hypothetical protein
MRQGFIITLITEEPDDRIGHVRICEERVHDTHLCMSLKIKGTLFWVGGQRALGKGVLGGLLHLLQSKRIF